MGRCAVIDVGTNSTKLHVAGIEGTRIEVLLDRTEVTRLGEGLYEGGQISPTAIDRTVKVVGEYVAAARQLGVEEFVVVGTMVLRAATNRNEFISRVMEDFGLEVEVLSGEEEARLACVAALAGLGRMEGSVCIFDTGGGSTEFIFLQDGEIRRKFSLPVGSRRLTDEIQLSDPVTSGELDDLTGRISGSIDLPDETVGALIGMGGTVTSLGSIMHGLAIYDPSLIQGSDLTLAEVDRQVEMFRRLTLNERREIVGLMPKRADVILAGAAIVGTILRKLKMSELKISDQGLRHGLIHDRFMSKI